MLFIGIDLGTSALKMMIVNEFGDILYEEKESYPIQYPKKGWSQQRPEDWYEACIAALNKILSHEELDKEDICAISFSGQMHGLVVMDENNEIIRPAILWNDARSVKECDYLNNTIGTQTLIDECGNIAFAGFTAPKLLWMKKNENANFKKIKKIMLPKDYLVYRFTDVFCTDVSDASGTLLYDVKHRKWSKKMLEICTISEEQLPKVYESYDVVGTLDPQIASSLGISSNIKVIIGAGDNAAAAIGMGCVEDGQCNLSIGTSGTIFMPTSEFKTNESSSLHSFCDASGKYHLMGCILSAASCNSWWMDTILQDKDYHKIQQEIDITKHHSVFFLPYLMGERSPINDPYAKGTFIGLSMDTTRDQMTQAIMEGVAFAYRDSYEIAIQMGMNINNITICGGGAKSKLWIYIIANVLQKEISFMEKEEGPAYGACILAMVGYGVYPDVVRASKKLNRVKEIIKPQEDLMRQYHSKYQLFREIYPPLKPIFQLMNRGTET